MSGPRAGYPDAALVEPLLAAAREAGRAILRHYHPDVARRAKPDGSPVTAADHEAEAIILPTLAAFDRAVPIVAEEEFAAGRAPELLGRRFWLVDPLDGTKEFLRGNGEFTVNIALVEDRVPILGVVHVPVTDEMFWSDGHGAFLRTGDGAIKRLRVRAAPAEGLVVLSSRSHADGDALKAFLKGRRIAETRVSGSSVKFCRLAAGEADLYPRLGPTMEWDTAAGQAVLAAAGGSVSTLDGTPLRYAKPGFLNPSFVARGA